MSIYGMTMNAHLDPDPYIACYYDITEHPHYHDCATCIHARTAFCMRGRHYVVDLWFDANLGKIEAQKALEEMDINYLEPLDKKFWK